MIKNMPYVNSINYNKDVIQKIIFWWMKSLNYINKGNTVNAQC